MLHRGSHGAPRGSSLVRLLAPNSAAVIALHVRFVLLWVQDAPEGWCQVWTPLVCTSRCHSSGVQSMLPSRWFSDLSFRVSQLFVVSCRAFMVEFVFNDLSTFEHLFMPQFVTLNRTCLFIEC